MSKNTSSRPTATNMALPEGWVSTTIGEVTQPKVEQSGPSHGEEFIYIDIASIDNDQKSITGPRVVPLGDAPSRARQVVHLGDVLVSMTRPNLNAVALVGPDLDGSIASTGFDILRAVEVTPGWLLLIVRGQAFVDSMTTLVQGALYPAVRSRDVRGFELPIPPLAEQRRIVAKVEELFKRLTAARARLATVLGVLKRLRQSVLSAACSGELTAEWRETHRNLVPPGPRYAKGVREPNLADLSGDVEIPSSWVWRRVGTYLDDARYGTSIKCTYDPHGVPVLRVPNITSGKLDLDDLKYCELADRDREKLRLWQGDVVVCRTNGSLELVGKAAVFNGVSGEYAFASYLIRLRCEHGSMLPEFLHIFLSSPLGRDQIEHAARTTAGQFNLNLDILRNLLVPLPALEEQREIVGRVDALFTMAEEIEAHVRSATVRAERLPQAILARAIRGELVPTEAQLAAEEGRSYEPASVLLERIQEAQKQHKPAERGRGGKQVARRSNRTRTKAPRPLDAVLSEEGKALTPERLFDLAGFDENSVDCFYEQLRTLVHEGKVREKRPNKKDVTLEVVAT